MKHRKSCITGFLITIFCLIMSACSSEGVKEIDKSLVMIKNAGMATYGTGFAVGIPGKTADTIITAYSVVAAPDGTAPKTAEVRTRGADKKLSANVIYADASENIAVLKLEGGPKELRPAVLRTGVNYNETIYARGYEGTGNIMSDFESFNGTDIIQYIGNITASTEMESSIGIYKYSNEFNRAAAGAPAVGKDRAVAGMCACSLSGMNTYSQYILSSDEIIKRLTNENIDFMTTDEVKYRNIIVAAIIIGAAALAAIIAFALVFARKTRKQP